MLILVWAKKEIYIFAIPTIFFITLTTSLLLDTGFDPQQREKVLMSKIVALLLAKTSHVTSNIQWEGFIWAKRCYATLKFVEDL